MIKTDQTFKVGDKIINFNKAYIIFKITKQLDKNNKEKIMSFRPYFPAKEKRFLTFSIPLNNINKTSIRKPISKKELNELLSELAKTPVVKTPIDISKIRDELNLNNLKTRVQIIKRLWREKNDKTANFTKSKQDVLDLAIKLLLEEVALVRNISLEKADKKIKMALKRSE